MTDTQAPAAIRAEMPQNRMRARGLALSAALTPNHVPMKEEAADSKNDEGGADVKVVVEDGFGVENVVIGIRRT